MYGSQNSDHGLNNMINDTFGGNEQAFFETVVKNTALNHANQIRLGKVFLNLPVNVGGTTVYVQGFATMEGLLKLSNITIRPY